MLAGGGGVSGSSGGGASRPPAQKRRPSPAANDDDDVCLVCCDAYTKHHRKRVTCAYCDMTCCSTCFQTYLLGLQADAHCMGCKRVMGAEFVATHVPKTWLLGKYKQHREKVLLDREKALLPDSQNLLENYREAQALRAELREHEAQRKALQRQVAEMLITSGTIRQRIQTIEHSRYTQRPADVPGGGGGGSGSTQQRRQFIRSCPMEGCRGFLSTAWRCGTCETWVCKDCGEPKLNGQHDEEHVCNPDIAASHALLQRDTRPCPKCASMIFKIDGCFDGGVEVRVWGGATKAARDVVAGDVLVGDDGTPRPVVETFDGQDDMFLIASPDAEDYVVSSQHTLVLSYCGADTLHMTVREFLEHVPDRHKGMLEGLAVTGGGGQFEVGGGQFEVGGGQFEVGGGQFEVGGGQFEVGGGQFEVGGGQFEVGGTPTAGINITTTGPISVSPMGTGRYYGWVVGGPTRRFILADGAIVHNCDQMWCTQCQVAFSWRTGQVVTNGVIHNPHYYAWMRERNNGQVPRNPGDVPCGGGDALPGMYTIEAVLRRHNSPPEINSSLRSIHRATRHVSGVDIPRLRREADDHQNARNADLRLKYLLQQIDEQEWKTKLQQREKKRERAAAVLQVYDMFVAVATDVFRGLADGARTPETACDELRHIRSYANSHLTDIAKRFNMTVTKV